MNCIKANAIFGALGCRESIFGRDDRTVIRTVVCSGFVPQINGPNLMGLSPQSGVITLRFVKESIPKLPFRQALNRAGTSRLSRVVVRDNQCVSCN